MIAGMEAAKHIKEAGHWYDKDGNQIATVRDATNTRDITPDVRHARKLDLGPGITSIIGCADKPPLRRWEKEQAILAALTLPRLEAESEKAWLGRVWQDMGEQAKKAAEEGTRIHAAIQGFFQKEPVPEGYGKHVLGVAEALYVACGTQEWRSEVGCASHLGYGTKADLCSDAWLIDFKGKEGDKAAFDRLETYDEHAMQLAATIVALQGEGSTMPEDSRAGICFVSRTEPGLARIIEVPHDALERGMYMFKGLLTYWQVKNRHRPTWSWGMK